MLHRRAGDVGAAADLAEARAVIDARTGDDEAPFAAVDRGLFEPVRRVARSDLGAAIPDGLAAVELGAFADGTPALRLVPELAGTVPTATEVRLSSGANGVAVRWPAGAPDRAEVRDLRSGVPYDEVAVEQVDGAVTVPLPTVFTPDRSWDVEVVVPARG